MSNESCLTPRDLFEACTPAYQVARSVHWRIGSCPEVVEISVSVLGIEHPLRIRVDLWKDLGKNPNVYFFPLEIDSIAFASQKADDIVKEICKVEGFEL